MIINFLNSREAELEFRHSDYLNRFGQKELQIRLKMINDMHTRDLADMGDTKLMRKVLLNIYIQSCRDFTPLETRTLEFYFEQISRKIKEKTGNSFFLPNGFAVNVLKLDDRDKSLDWGYPFTINETIVIPTNYLNDVMSSYQKYYNSLVDVFEPNNGPKAARSDKAYLSKHMVNLYHEIIHIMQRSNKLSKIYSRIFDHIYQKIWGFVKINSSRQLSRVVDSNYVSNPDGANFEWLVAIYNYQTKRDTLFAPTLIYDFNRNRPTGVLIEVEQSRNGEYSLTNRWDYLERFPNYVDKFYGLEGQLYHPNEIIAHILSEYLILDKMYTNHPDSFYFYDYINKYLLNPTNLV